MLPIHIAGMITSVLGLLKIPIDLYKDHKKLGRRMMSELDSLMSDLELMKEGSMSYDELRLTELVYDIEDFAQGLWIPEASGPLLSAIGRDPREKYVNRIKFFKQEISKLEKLQQNAESKSEQGGGTSADTSSSSGPASSVAAGEYTTEESLVGITKPKEVILDLLKKPASSEEAEKQPPKVISIVGCPGVGKTALARAVYDHYYVPSAASSSRDFDCLAWVEAAGCNDKKALLRKILQKVVEGLRYSHTHLPSEGDDDNAVSKKLHGILGDKRYLVFIDDVRQAKVLKDTIDDHFPKTIKSGMVIVTTSDHQVANVCSRRSYVYTMKCLDDTESEILLCKKAFDKIPNDVDRAQRAGSKGIITKCGGLPLALISVAKHLSNTGYVDRDYFDKLVKDLGRHYLAGSKAEEEFRKLRIALGQCYDGLPDYDHKTCMLSLSIFPRDHAIKTKSLVRRLIAEGLVASDGTKCIDELIDVIDHGHECFKSLFNRCIVEPLQVCSCSKDIKRFRVNGGIMLEFIIHKSQSTNFVTLIQGEEVMRNKKGRIRRLSVQSSTKNKFQEVAVENAMSETIRSLTIIPPQERGEVSKIVQSCKFLRLLDLEGCMGIDEEFLKGICELVYLKYLSLRKTDVKKIPRRIKQLQCLQTLDIRETQTPEINLPIEVIMLPKLAFLFGQFVLPKMSSIAKEFLSAKSELHTLAGIVDMEEGFEHIILEARNLRKVEVSKPLQQKFFGTRTNFFRSLLCRFTSLESLSIRSSQLSPDILASLGRVPCKVGRMKLSGTIGGLPSIDTLTMLDTLNKLQLSYTGLTSKELSTLQHIPCLEYLKLQDNKRESWDGIFSVLKDGFQSLKRLCFQASKLPKLEFDPESMKALTSLHLRCPDMSQMQAVEDIRNCMNHIIELNEVVLHSSANEAIVDAWKTAAKSNPSRPCVTTNTCS